MTLSVHVYPFTVRRRNIFVTKQMPKYDCKELEVHEQHFQVEKSVSVKNTGAHFSLNISANQDLEPMLSGSVT